MGTGTNAYPIDSCGYYKIEGWDRSDTFFILINGFKVRGYNSLYINNVPPIGANDTIDLGNLYLVRVPVEPNLRYYGLAERWKNRKLTRETRRAYNKERRDFNFVDMVTDCIGSALTGLHH